MANCRHIFLAPRKQKNLHKAKFALTACSIQKAFRALAFSGREKFGNSFYFENRAATFNSFCNNLGV